MSDLDDIMELLEPDPWGQAEAHSNKFSRANLRPLRLYLEHPTGKYFYTPDGEGCIWFDTLEEALEETDAFGQPIIILSQELSDF